MDNKYYGAADNASDEGQVPAAGINAPPLPDCVKSKTKVFRYSVLGIALSAALFRALALIFSFDADPGYFVKGAFLPTVGNVLTVIGVCFCVSALFFIPKNTLPAKADFGTGRVFFASVYTGFIMVADAFYRLYNILQPQTREDIRTYFADPQMRTQRIVAVVNIACIVVSALAGLSFYLKASGKTGKKGMAIIGLFPAIRSICGIALCYFDMTVPLNSPLKTGVEFSLMAIMLFMTYEDRFELYEEKVMPRCYFASGLAAVVICGVNGIAGIVAYFGGFCENGELSIESFIIISMFFYVLARLRAYCENRGIPLASDDGDGTDEDVGSEEEQTEAGCENNCAESVDSGSGNGDRE